MFLCRDELWKNLYEQRGIRYILNLADAERAMSKHTYPVPENLIENIPYDKVGSFLLPRLAFFIPLAFVLYLLISARLYLNQPAGKFCRKRSCLGCKMTLRTIRSCFVSAFPGNYFLMSVDFWRSETAS